jgi:ketosteroid isomerase-like protein
MSQENVKLVYAGYEAWNRREIDRIPEIFHPAIVWRTSGLWPDFEPVYEGHEGVARFWRAMFEPWAEIRIEPEKTHEAGDAVIVGGQFRGVGRGSGVTTLKEFAHGHLFKDRLVIEMVAYRSWSEALSKAAELAE